MTRSNIVTLWPIVLIFPECPYGYIVISDPYLVPLKLVAMQVLLNLKNKILKNKILLISYNSPEVMR